MQLWMGLTPRTGFNPAFIATFVWSSIVLLALDDVSIFWGWCDDDQHNTNTLLSKTQLMVTRDIHST